MVKLILFMYESWAQLDLAADGLTPAEANDRHEGARRIAWTLGHVTNMVDSWINMRFQGLPPHPLIGDAMFRAGASGEAPDWRLVLEGVAEVRQAARRLLDSEPGPDLDRTVPYAGSIPFLRSTGLSARYALMRIAAHHFIHAGEVRAVRAAQGQVFADAPDWGLSLA